MRRTRLAALSIATLVAAACDRPADPAWIAERLAEARERDTAARAAHASDDERTRWTLEVVGPDGTSEVLPFAALSSLPRTEVTTTEPDEAAHHDVVRFAGVRISDLVGRAAAGEHAPDVTLLASDGFRATLQMEDVRLFPIILATDANGAPLGRDHGGPLYSVFPTMQFPELGTRYTSSAWVFYVTHVIVGTAPPSVRVGDRVVTAAELEALPTTSLSAVVGYRTGWPSEPVRVHGVLLRDLLALAGATLGDGDHVRVMSRAPVTRGEGRPTLLSADDVRSADVILALRYGESREPIPSRLGGPLALAFPTSVAAHLTDHDWLTFVDALSVVPAATEVP